MNIEKYLKNKDIKIKSEDLDIEALEKDLRTGYYDESTYKKAISDKEKELTDKYTKDLADKDNSLATFTKQMEETNNKLKGVSFENTAFKKGFKQDQLERVSKLRSTYTDLDDDKALDTIATEFKDIFFKEAPVVTPPSANPMGAGGTTPPAEQKITRHTKYADLI